MLKVINPGIYSSIQDQGRFGFAHLGVPVSGCMDEVSANFANCILRNLPNMAVLEITFGLAKFQFLSPSVICITGANCIPKLNGDLIELNAPITVVENDILSFGVASFGVRAYLAVKNGFQTATKLKSKSQFKNITENFCLHKNELLYFEPFTKSITKTNAKLKVNHLQFSLQQLFCNEGPEFYLLSKKQRELLFTNSFSISKDNNRMGYRLNEEIPNELHSILTSSVLPGTVQLTPSGKLIVLLKDCQVTGGYPRILQLTREAIAVIAQKSTNQLVNFSLNLI